MSRVKVAINEKNVSLFSHNRSTSPIAVDSDSDFISKRVPGIRSCTKHLSRFYHLGHPNSLPCNDVAGIYPADHKHVSNRLRKPLMPSIRQLQPLMPRIAI